MMTLIPYPLNSKIDESKSPPRNWHAYPPQPVQASRTSESLIKFLKISLRIKMVEKLSLMLCIARALSKRKRVLRIVLNRLHRHLLLNSRLRSRGLNNIIVGPARHNLFQESVLNALTHRSTFNIVLMLNYSRKLIFTILFLMNRYDRYQSKFVGKWGQPE